MINNNLFYFPREMKLLFFFSKIYYRVWTMERLLTRSRNGDRLSITSRLRGGQNFLAKIF